MPHPAVSSGGSGQACKTIDFFGVPDRVQVPVVDGIQSLGWVGGVSVAAGGIAQFVPPQGGSSTAAVFLNGQSDIITFANPVSSVSFQYATASETTVTAYNSSGQQVASQDAPGNWNHTSVYVNWSPLQLQPQSGQTISSISISTVGGVLNNFYGIEGFTYCTPVDIDSVEITQAIQELQTVSALQRYLAVSNNEPPTPIIAGKQAALRVYMSTVKVAVDVYVNLTIPNVLNVTKAISLVPGCDTLKQRLRTDCQSADFYFPAPAGTWIATLTLLDSGQNQMQPPISFTFASRQTDTLRLQAFTVCDSTVLFGKIPLCGFSFQILGRTDLLEKIAPTNHFQLDLGIDMVTRDFAPYDSCPDHSDYANCLWYKWHDDVARDLGRLYVTKGDLIADPVVGQRTTEYGMVRYEVPGPMGNADDIPSHAAESHVYVPRFASVTDATPETVAHETGHTLGIHHTNTGIPHEDAAPPGCYSFAPDPGTDWPWRGVNKVNDNGDNTTRSANRPEVPFDVALQKPLLPPTYETLSYCVPRWISPYTYTKEAAALAAIGFGPAAAEPNLRRTEARASATQAFWIVSGTIPAGGPPVFDALFQSVMTGDTSGGSGTYSLEVQNATGNALFTRMFTPQTPQGDADLLGIESVGSPHFTQLLPVTAGAAGIVLKDPNGVILGKIALGGAAPTVTITSPTAGFTENGPINWTITDPDSAVFTSRVFYSADNGATWAEIAQVPDSGTTLGVDFSKLPGSNGQSLIKVLVSDGVNTGQAVSPAFSIPKKTPSYIQIFSPTPNFSQQAADPVLLRGMAFDVDDGVLSGGALAWSSSLQGALGNGSPLSLNLQPGLHTITLTATDSDNNSVSTSTTVLIGEAPPVLNIYFNILSSPPDSNSTCLQAVVAASPGANGAPLAYLQYSIDGGTTFSPIPGNVSPAVFVIPGTGFIDLVFAAGDASNRNTAQSVNYLNLNPCGPLLVPNVAGMTLANATNTLNNAALPVGLVTQAASATVAAGNVISQSPAAGATIPVGVSDDVNLTISAGPQVPVPNVVGQAQPDALAAIAGAGLTAGTITTASSTTVPGGRVITETPAAGTPASAGAAVNLVVSTGSGLSVAAPAVLPTATVGFPYSIVVNATGGSGAYIWSATGLPGGLAIDQNGTISGTPAGNNGNYPVQVTVTDSAYATSSNRSYSLTVDPALSIASPAGLPGGAVGTAYSVTVKASGGSGSFAWSASGLPPGMSIGPATGIISGTPGSARGSPFKVQVTVEDSASAAAISVFQLIVSTPLAITGPASLPAGVAGSAYTPTTIVAAGGSGAYQWSASGLPTGLGIDAKTGVISGTPSTIIGSPFHVTVTVNDGNTTANAGYDLTVLAFSPCDVTRNGITDVLDVQHILGEALGKLSPLDDLTQDGVVNLADVQIVLNAALSLRCFAK